jgi:hypothetical protein
VRSPRRGSSDGARGVSYGAYVDTDAKTLATSPFYTSNSWSSPPNQQMTMPVKAGSLLRFECDYDNTMGTQEYFQGPSAQTNEMCMFIGASASLMPLVQCIQNSCATQCGAGSAGCAACVASSCGAQYGACQAQTCN